MGRTCDCAYCSPERIRMARRNDSATGTLDSEHNGGLETGESKSQLRPSRGGWQRGPILSMNTDTGELFLLRNRPSIQGGITTLVCHVVVSGLPFWHVKGAVRSLYGMRRPV